MLGGVKWVCWQYLLPLFLFSVIPAEKFCVSWALPLIECVTVWALKLPVPHTDVLKTHEPQNFSAGITGSQRNWQRTFAQTISYPSSQLHKKCRQPLKTLYLSKSTLFYSLHHFIPLPL